MAILEIYTFPDQILRKKAETVTVFDQELERTVQSMLETMYVSSGIGLAAIQAGILKQIIVIDFRGEIQRAEKITVEYQDVTGEIQKMEAEEMMSICLQHEIDHLNGVLFIDHLPLLKQKMVKKRLKKLAKVEA